MRAFWSFAAVALAFAAKSERTFLFPVRNPLSQRWGGAQRCAHSCDAATHQASRPNSKRCVRERFQAFRVLTCGAIRRFSIVLHNAIERLLGRSTTVHTHLRYVCSSSKAGRRLPLRSRIVPNRTNGEFTTKGKRAQKITIGAGLPRSGTTNGSA